MDVNCGLTVLLKRSERDFTYDNQTLMTCEALYPALEPLNNEVARRINAYYELVLNQFFEDCRKLFPNATEDYLAASQSGYEFRPYQAMLMFTPSYSRNCVLSLYRDHYQYLGGAHGSTLRSSETWNLTDGSRFELKDFFPGENDLNASLIASINSQIAARIKSEGDYYFNGYEKNVEKFFKPESYYLSDGNLVIYFQQYDIAPYAGGIVEFEFPFSSQETGAL